MFGVELLAHFFPERAFFAPVTPAEDGDLAPLLAQRACKDFHHRGFSGTAAGEVADADHKASQSVVADDTAVIKPEPELGDVAEKTGNKKEQSQERPVKPFLPSAGHHFEEILFKILGF